jgi:hypothetical protein
LIVEKGEAEVEPLIVSKNFRGQGVGTKPVETVVSEAQKRKVRFLDVKPVARNMKTIRFLHKLSFRNLGHIDMFMDFSGRYGSPGSKFMSANSASDKPSQCLSFHCLSIDFTRLSNRSLTLSSVIRVPATEL